MKQTTSYFAELCQTVEALRGPNGCPWDKAQTHQSLTPYALEEAFELVEAIEAGNQSEIIEELGDCLLQVVLHSEIARQDGRFTIDDVCQSITAKMIRRHPHVFSDTKVNSIDEVWANWAQIKEAEKKSKPKTGFQIPQALPSLQRAQKIGRKTADYAFDWSKPEEVLLKVHEEIAELTSAMDSGNPKEITHEIGDLLFSVAQLARHLDQEPESCLREANRRFEKRFFAMLEQAREDKQDFVKLPPAQKEKLWEQVKASLP